MSTSTISGLSITRKCRNALLHATDLVNGVKKMLKITPARLKLLPRCFIADSVKRFFLSDSYKCEEAWKKRLRNPVFQKLQPNSLYHGLDVNFQRKLRICVLDVDLLLSMDLEPNYKNELEDVLLQIRLAPECGILPERTTHAAIRWFMENVSKEELLNALSDRLNYGLFPDHFLNNLLMDKYLKEKDPVSAVKIAVLQMIQEDFDHPIMKALALHCCYSYLESKEIWLSYKEPEPDPDEEVKKIRVRYARNPYFDDHFDITDTNHLVGKTLWLFGRTVEGGVGTSSQLVGLVLYEKYDQCAEFLESVTKDNKKIHKDAVEKAKSYILKKPKQVEDEKPEEVKDEGGKEKAAEGNEVLDERKVKVLKLLEQVGKGNLEMGSLLSATTELVKKVVKENEGKDIEHQCKLYQQWEDEREKHIQEEIVRMKQEKIKSEIQKTKAELMKEEERIFFFEREEDIKFEAEEKEKRKESMVFYKGKGKAKEVSEDYIPPDLKRRSN